MPRPKGKILESENANGPLSRREGAMGPVESLADCLFVGLMVSILQLVVPKVGPEAHPDRARFTMPAAPKISLGGTPYVHLAVIVSTKPVVI